MYFFCSIIIIDNINALHTKTNTQNHSHKSRSRTRSKKQFQEQNFQNLEHFLKPKILGGNTSNSNLIGGNEKPTIYESVIRTHSTSINNQNQNHYQSQYQNQYQNTNNSNRNFNLNEIKNMMHFNYNHGGKAVPTNNYNNNFNLNNNYENELNRLGQDALSIPVKLDRLSNYQEPLMAKYKYESPTFLSTKSEKKVKGPKLINLPKMPMITPALQATSAKDVKMIKKKLNKAKNKKQKLKALKFSKKILKKDAKKLCDKIKKEIEKVLGAKKTALNLSNVLNRYTVQIKKDEAKKLKLTDRLEVKRELKNKIFREVEGFRNTGKEFTLLKKIDKKDMLRIVNQIKARLGF